MQLRQGEDRIESCITLLLGRRSERLHKPEKHPYPQTRTRPNRPVLKNGCTDVCALPKTENAASQGLFPYEVSATSYKFVLGVYRVLVSQLGLA